MPQLGAEASAPGEHDRPRTGMQGEGVWTGTTAQGAGKWATAGAANEGPGKEQTGKGAVP